MEDEGAGTGRERRRDERLPCDGVAEVVVFKSDLLFRGEVRDISRSGCYIETRARLNLERFAEIELRFSAHGRQFRTLARVTDLRPGKGLGVEFVPGDPRMDSQFRELLEQLASSPAGA